MGTEDTFFGTEQQHGHSSVKRKDFLLTEVHNKPLTRMFFFQKRLILWSLGKMNTQIDRKSWIILLLAWTNLEVYSLASLPPIMRQSEGLPLKYVCWEIAHYALRPQGGRLVTNTAVWFWLAGVFGRCFLLLTDEIGTMKNRKIDGKLKILIKVPWGIISCKHVCFVLWTQFGEGLGRRLREQRTIQTRAETGTGRRGPWGY